MTATPKQALQLEVVRRFYVSLVKRTFLQTILFLSLFLHGEGQVKTTAFIVVLISLVCGSAAAPQRGTKGISIAAVQQLKAPLTLEDVERVFGPSEPQPGPRVSYPSADHRGMSLWFWYSRPQTKGSVAASEVLIRCVILATTVTEEKRQVVWPSDSADVVPEKLIRQVVDSYQTRR